MITSWDIYWITRLDAICFGLGILCLLLLSFLILLISLRMVALKDRDWSGHKREWVAPFNERYFKKLFITNIVLFFIILSIGVLTPSTKEAAAIYLIPKIANNEQIQKVPDNVFKLLNTKMEQWINDMGKEKTK